MVVEYVVAGPVLDVGCGGGRLSAAIANGVGHEVVGVDSSVAQMHRVARHRRSGVAGVRASAMHLPFAEQRFAVVVSSCAVKHWPDPASGLAECVRVARIGAPVVIVEIDGAATMEEVQRFAMALPLPFGLREAYARFAMRTVVGVAPRSDELAAALRSAGASEIAAEHVDGLPFVICRGRRL
jgi:ubiquinone/menaquinone biosynthesis C-methylase UbiE